MYYTYLLKCVPTNEFYYGVKYSKDSDPTTFWKTYFTSSVPVLKRIDIFGKDAFEYEIRKTFTCPKKARIWEDKVLRKLNVISRCDFLNKSYGLCYDKRKTRKGCIMMYFINENSYRYVDKSLVSHLLDNNIAIIKGRPKPNGFGKKISDALSGKPKSQEHKEKNRIAHKGKKYGTNIERFGEQTANELRQIKSKLAKDYYKTNTHHAKNKNYEEIYGIDKAAEMKLKKSQFLTKNNPGKKMKGKSYEKLYGEAKSFELKLKRSINGKKNKKTYSVYHNNILIHIGDRFSTATYISESFSVPISNILYRKDLLNQLNIVIETNQQHS